MTEKLKLNSGYTVERLPSVLRGLIRASAVKPPDVVAADQNDLASGAASGRHGSDFFDAISEEEALLLYSIVRDIRPIHSVEIGFCCGGSAMAILQAISDNGIGLHHICDPYQSTYAANRGLKNVEQANLKEYLDFHEAFPETVVPRLPRLQFAFIDASHLFDYTMLDFVLVDRLLDVGGVVAFHDLWMPSLQKVVRFLLSNRDYELYRSDTANQFVSTKTSMVRKLFSNILRTFPKSSKLFTQEILHPWTEFRLGNIAVLRKTAEDKREWRSYTPF